jgi:hypothetical protein
MKTLLVIILCFSFSSCTLFEKNSGSNEMESLTQDVLKSKQGIEIDVKPISKESK